LPNEYPALAIPLRRLRANFSSATGEIAVLRSAFRVHPAAVTRVCHAAQREQGVAYIPSYNGVPWFLPV